MHFSNRNMSFFQLLKEFLPLFVARVLFSEAVAVNRRTEPGGEEKADEETRSGRR